MCSCGKKKQSSSASPVSVDPSLTVKIAVEQDTFYNSGVLNAPVILTSKKPNVVFAQDILVLKQKGIDYKVVA